MLPNLCLLVFHNSLMNIRWNSNGVLVEFSSQSRCCFCVILFRNWTIQIDKYMASKIPKRPTNPVVVPGFPRGVISEWVRQPSFCKMFAENCMKMKEIWTERGARVTGSRHRPTTDTISPLLYHTSNKKMSLKDHFRNKFYGPKTKSNFCATKSLI